MPVLSHSAGCLHLHLTADRVRVSKFVGSLQPGRACRKLQALQFEEDYVETEWARWQAIPYLGTVQIPVQMNRSSVLLKSKYIKALKYLSLQNLRDCTTIKNRNVNKSYSALHSEDEMQHVRAGCVLEDVGRPTHAQAQPGYC
jgi:hypothetical protein